METEDVAEMLQCLSCLKITTMKGDEGHREVAQRYWASYARITSQMKDHGPNLGSLY